MNRLRRVGAPPAHRSRHYILHIHKFSISLCHYYQWPGSVTFSVSPSSCTNHLPERLGVCAAEWRNCLGYPVNFLGAQQIGKGGYREQVSTGTAMQLFSAGSHGRCHHAGVAVFVSPLCRGWLKWLQGAGQKCNSHRSATRRPRAEGPLIPGGWLSRFSHHSLNLLP